MPTIAIDYTPAHKQGGGIGRYVRELVAALAALPADEAPFDYRLFVSGATHDQMGRAPAPHLAWTPTRLSPPWLARMWHRARVPIPVQRFVGDVALYHATDFVLPPVKRGIPALLTVHDLSFVRVPDAASPALRRYLNEVVPRSVHRADHVLADSQATKDDLMALYEVDSSRITVLLSGVDARFQPVLGSDLVTTRKKYGLGSRPYILSVGTVQPRKNYGRLVEALAILRDRGLDLSLAIIGGKGWLEDPIYATIHETGMTDYVRFTGFADETDLPALYSSAVAFAFPSLYEGFGLPILEAMACHTPVMTSNLSSLPEVAGDSALMVDPYDTEAIAHSLRRLIEDSALREILIARGAERVKQFTWERAARQLREIYRKQLGL